MIGEKLKQLRLKSGITQKTLADKLFVTPQAISRWENNEVEPSISTIMELSKIYNISVDELLGSNPQKKPEPEVRVEKQYVYQQPVKPVLAVCEECNTPIYNSNDIVRKSYSSGRPASVTSRIICRNCEKKRIENKKRENVQINNNRRKRSFWISGILAAVVLIISAYLTFSYGKYEFLAIGIATAILSFTYLSCMLLMNNPIGGITLTIIQWGFVKFPGLIFTLDLDGIIWLLTVKLALWILGFTIAAAFTVLAVAVGSICSLFVYPYALYKNINHPEVLE